MGLWNSSVIRGVNYGEDNSFRKIMVPAKFLRSIKTFHHVMLSLRKLLLFPPLLCSFVSVFVDFFDRLN
jgi:hypothetical protein